MLSCIAGFLAVPDGYVGDERGDGLGQPDPAPAKGSQRRTGYTAYPCRTGKRGKDK